MQYRCAFMPDPGPLTAAWHWRSSWWRTLLWLLVACVAVQGLASGTRRAFGMGHFHHLPLLADSAFQRGVGPHRFANAPTPFGGRLRAHVQQASDNDRLHSHAAVEHHSHAAGQPGVVTVDDGGSNSNRRSAKVAQLLNLAQQALDLPGALPAGLATAQVQAATGWPAGARIAFDSRSTQPLLRPPRHG